MVHYTVTRLREQLLVEVRRAFELCDGPTSIDPGAIACELLRSEHGAELSTLRDLPLDQLSVALVLAHLEALAFGLSSRLSVSIARRCFILLLNRRHFLPDVPTTRPQAR